MIDDFLEVDHAREIEDPALIKFPQTVLADRLDKPRDSSKPRRRRRRRWRRVTRIFLCVI